MSTGACKSWGCHSSFQQGNTKTYIYYGIDLNNPGPRVQKQETKVTRVKKKDASLGLSVTTAKARPGRRVRYRVADPPRPRTSATRALVRVALCQCENTRAVGISATSVDYLRPNEIWDTCRCWQNFPQNPNSGHLRPPAENTTSGISFPVLAPDGCRTGVWERIVARRAKQGCLPALREHPSRGNLALRVGACEQFRDALALRLIGSLISVLHERATSRAYQAR